MVTSRQKKRLLNIKLMKMSEIKIELPEGFELKQEGDVYKIVEKEFKLEEGKDYRNRQMGNIVIDRKGDDCNFGFLYGRFHDSMECCNPEWREATKEEVIEAFEEECVRVFGENWKDVEIEECMFHSNSKYLNTGLYPLPLIFKDFDGWQVWNKNGCIYFKGKWAKKKEVKYAEDLKDIDRPYYIDIDGGVGSSEYQTIEHLPTRGLTEGVIALIQLLSFRQDVWDKSGKPEGAPAYGIRYTNSSFVVSRQGPHGLLYFKTKEQAEYFLDKHKELIIEYLNNLK